MKKLLILLAAISATTLYGQEFYAGETTSVELYFDQEQFGEQFAVAVDNDDAYNYYVIDLTKFSSQIEKTIYLNLIYEDHTLISIDSDIYKDQLWFKAPMKKAEDEVICLLKDYKESAQNKAGMMTEEEKSRWLDTNEKLNQKKDQPF